MIHHDLGSGISRALEAWPHIELQDHKNGNEFRAVITRPASKVQLIARLKQTRPTQSQAKSQANHTPQSHPQ